MIKFLCSFSLTLCAISGAQASQLCDQVRHVPTDGVTYRPTPNVVPADLNAATLNLGDVTIPLTAYLVEDLGLNVPVSASSLGDVIIKENGSVVFNGEDISERVNILCNVPRKPSTQSKGNVELEIKQIKKETNEQEYKQSGQVLVETVKFEKLNQPKSSLDITDAQQSDEPIYGGFGQDQVNGTYND